VITAGTMAVLIATVVVVAERVELVAIVELTTLVLTDVEEGAAAMVDTAPGVVA